MTDTTPEMSVRQRRAVTVQEHIEAENRHDPDATVATFSTSMARYDIPAFGPDGQRHDHAAIRDLVAEMFAVFPDFHVEAGPMRHGDDHILVEGWVSGTQHADWAGIPNTGRSFSTRMAIIFDFEDDQLVCEHVYFDFADAARQLALSAQ